MVDPSEQQEHPFEPIRPIAPLPIGKRQKGRAVDGFHRIGKQDRLAGIVEPPAGAWAGNCSFTAHSA